MKKNNRLGAHFWLNSATALLAVIAVVAYIIGAVGFAYYDDLNPMILCVAGAAAVAAVVNAVLSAKLGDKLLLSLLGLAVGAALVVCTIWITEARVYSIGVLLFSELEKDNVEGYYALYCSLAAMGCLLVAVICNVVSNFCSPQKEEA